MPQIDHGDFNRARLMKHEVMTLTKLFLQGTVWPGKDSAKTDASKVRGRSLIITRQRRIQKKMTRSAKVTLGAPMCE